MAPSPDTHAQSTAGDPATEACWAGIRAMDTKLIRGESFSGHEKNCVYLNTGTTRWASAGFLTGFDFDDDARAVAVTDWDGDGDLDVWIANRTAPRIRYLRNDAPRAGTWVAFTLRATRGHHQAHGARVTLRLKGDARPLLRELRAGEGFLAQSTRRLYFGLGKNAEIATVTVRWHAGVEETFAPPATGAAWQLVEGTGIPQPIPARASAPAPLAPGPVPIPSQTFPAAVSLAWPEPLPPITWTDRQKKSHRLDKPSATPRLVVLWPAKKPAPTYTTPGVQILLLSDIASATQPNELDADSLARLERMGRAVFEMEEPLHPPQAWLLTADARLAVWYREPPDDKELAAHLAALTLTPEARLAAHLPFPGTWHKPPFHFHPIEIATYLLEEQRAPAAAAEYLLTNAPAFRSSIRHPATCRDTADALADTQPATAADLYREAYLSGLTDATTCLGAARALLRIQPPTEETTASALLYARRAADRTPQPDPAILTTLALAHHASGNTEDARATAREALAHSPTAEQRAALAPLLKE